MPINFSTNGSTAFTRPPRIVTVGDTFSGCPGASRTTPLISMTFTTANTSVIAIEGEIIRRRDANGRCDIGLYGPGYPNGASDAYYSTTVLLSQTLDYNDGYNSEWDNAGLRWIGYAPAGTLTFYLGFTDYAICTSSWGCGSDWGRISAIIFE